MLKVRVVFGEDMNPVNEETYHFKTKAEVEAFFLGLQEGEGWQGWTVIEDESGTLIADGYDGKGGSPSTRGGRMTKEEKEITKAFVAMIKRNGWNPMKSGDGLAWFGGKTHHQLADHLPDKALEGRNHEDIDYLVLGWRT